MRVGIIPVHNSPNFGASLQSYALWKYISDLGHNAEVIDLYRPHQPEYVKSKKYVSRMGRRTFGESLKTYIKKLLGRNPAQLDALNIEATRRFCSFNAQVKLSRPYYSVDDLYANPPIYDVYITGSDQLWSPTQPFCLEPYFLTFVPEGKKRMSYATSVGITNLTSRERKDFAGWLKAYDSISVREKQARGLLQSMAEKDIEVMPDPTFLLDRERWESVAVWPQQEKPYILIFTLYFNENLLNYALALGRQSNLKVIYLTSRQPEPVGGEYEAVKSVGPREWIGLIAKAEMVITDSFHGTVFSIIMGTNNFFTYISTNRGIRIIELLETFGLSDHLLPSELEPNFSELSEKTVDHQAVEQIILQERAKGRNYLAENLI